MSDPSNAHRLDPGWMQELRRMPSLDGFLFGDYFDRDGYRQIGDTLLDLGYIEHGSRDGKAAYELTDAGRAWFAANGAA